MAKRNAVRWDSWGPGYDARIARMERLAHRNAVDALDDLGVRATVYDRGVLETSRARAAWEAMLDA